jgi:MoaA/NifB/PqqE/SkfB family radical SAM enzyme
MTKEKWINTIQDLKKSGCESLQFIGGEPTTHPDLSELIQYANKVGISKIQVYTNGIAISDKLMAIFKENQVDLAFSVYSYNAQLHDAVTTTSGSFRRTEKSILKALDEGIDVAVGIIAMDSEDNLEIQKTIDYVEGLGVDSHEIGVDRVREFGRGKGDPSVGDKLSELCGRCWSERVAINDEGNISPCVMSRFVQLGHISAGLNNVLQSENMRKFQLSKPSQLSDEGNFLESSCKPGTNCRCPKIRETGTQLSSIA